MVRQPAWRGDNTLVLKHLARRGRDSLAGTLQSLPISSKILGPPKGYYNSFSEYTQATKDPAAKEWPILSPESFTLTAPSAVDTEIPIFQPLRQESPSFGLYRISNGRFHRDARAVLTKDDRILTSFSAWMGEGPQDNWLFRKTMLG
jgi:hypothetical protein